MQAFNFQLVTNAVCFTFAYWIYLYFYLQFYKNVLDFQLHSGSNSLLSKLIHQSYHGRMDTVSLSGTIPVQMLLEIGLDKLKKDYISFFIGKSFSQLKKLKSTSQLSAVVISRFYLSTCPESFVVLALPLVHCKTGTCILWSLVPSQ